MRNIKKKIIAVAMALTLVFAGTAFAADIDYVKAYGPKFNTIDVNDSGSYLLWDLNNDGIAELIIGHGPYSADYTNEVWATVDGLGTYLVGSIDNMQTFYLAPDGNGLYAVYGHMGHEIITRVTMVDNQLVTEVVSDRDLGYGEDYYSSEAKIAEADLDDISLLVRWNYVN